MRSPLARTATTGTIPAPVGGWNARDALTAMKPADAVVLDNLVPGSEGVATRGGASAYATGLGAPVSALMRYTPPGAVPRLFAAAGGNVFDVTQAGAVGVAVLSGQLGSAWKGVMFSTAGGSYLMAFDGADPPQRFDGTSWTAIKWATLPATQNTPAYPYTLTPSKLMAPQVFGSRLWAIEKGSLRVWFKPVNAIDTAPASGDTNLADYDQCFDLGSQFTLGGALVQMAVLTRDGGTGSGNYACFISSSGQIAIYAGIDPTNAATWSRVGVYRIAPPIGDRPAIQAGADVAVLTETGLVPLSEILALDPAQDEQVAITDKIKGAVQTAYQAAATFPGWAVQEYPMGNLLIINVPSPDGSFRQFVMHLLTQAWCSFSGLPATCWGLLGDHIYFGTPDGRVCLYDVGSSDALFPAAAPVAQPIRFTCLPAFSAFRTAGRKTFRQARPLFTSALGYRAPIALRADYDTTALPLSQPPIRIGATPWGSKWGSPWGPVIKPSAAWTGVRGSGLVASILVSGASFYPFRLDKIDVLFEASGDPL